MHSSFGVHRRHSDDVTSTTFTTTTFRPRRSISSSAGQQQPRHVVCMLNNYSHSLPSNQQQTPSDDDEQIKDPNHNLTQEQGENSFNDEDEDEDEIANELNLAVVVGNEDAQSLKGEPINNEHGSLDVAFIDDTDLERNLSNNNNNQHDQGITQIDGQILNNENETLSQTIVPERNSIEIKDNQESTVPVLVEKSLNQDEDLDEILRRNENRCIRLTDSDVS
jgi:hypothetical protein